MRLWADADTGVMDIVYGGAKAGGKSYLMCMLLAGNAIVYPDTRYFIARAELKDLRQSTSFTMKKLLTDKWGLKEDRDFRFNGQDNFWQFSNGSIIDYIQARFEPQDPHYARFGSREYTQGAIEEAGDRIDEQARNNLIATCGRYNNDRYGLPIKLLQTCNPTQNYLYHQYYKPFKLGQLPSHKAFIQAFAEDNPFLPQAYITNLEKNLSHNEKQRLLLGNWEYDADPAALCDFNAISDAFTNELPYGNEKRISADIALLGRDRFVGGLWHGDNVVEVVIDMPRSRADQVVDEIRKVDARHNAGRSRIVVDSDGIGAFVSGFMHGVNEFHGNGAATDDEYMNIKTQCAYKLAELINKRMLRIVCSDAQRAAIMDELGVLKALDIDADESRKRIIAKEDMKRQIGRSPDYLDMLIMGMYLQVKETNYNIIYV